MTEVATCPTCNGRKYIAEDKEPCPTCDGTGVVWRDHRTEEASAVAVNNLDLTYDGN